MKSNFFKGCFVLFKAWVFISFSHPPFFHLLLLRLFEAWRMNWCLIENINHFAYYRVSFLSLFCCVREREKKKVICWLISFFLLLQTLGFIVSNILFDWFFKGRNSISIMYVCVYESVCNVITYFFDVINFLRIVSTPKLEKKNSLLSKIKITFFFFLQTTQSCVIIET